MFDEYYPQENEGVFPNYTLDEFLSVQFSDDEKKKFWVALDTIFIQERPIQLVVEPIYENVYSGQRGLLYMLEEVQYIGFPNVEICGMIPGVFNVDWDYSHEAFGLPFTPKIKLKTHLVLTPDNMMNTAHFVRKVKEWAQEIVNILERSRSENVVK